MPKNLYPVNSIIRNFRTQVKNGKNFLMYMSPKVDTLMANNNMNRFSIPPFIKLKA